MIEKKDKFDDIYVYLYENGHKGIVPDNDIISSHVAFQYEIDFIKNRMCQRIKYNRMFVVSLVESGLHIDDALRQLFQKRHTIVIDGNGKKKKKHYGDFVAKRIRKPPGWSFIFTDDELLDLEKKYGKTSEARLEGSYNIYDAYKIEDRRFKEIKKKKVKKKVKNDSGN